MIIAGTGHRPKYCPCKYDDKHPWLIDLKSRLWDYLELWQNVEPLIVRSGMAIGWDTWLAQVAIDLDIEVHCYIPFEGQETKWPYDSRKEYDRIKSKASKLNYTGEKYYPKVFLDRDVEMITGTEKVLSLLNPEVKSGGTFYTVNEAKKRNIEVINFWKD